jgi:hypothetical protein
MVLTRSQARSRAQEARNPSALQIGKYFRFMDLPPEIRNRVYRFAAIDSGPSKLSTLSLPALAATSKTVRDESFPVFFAESQFEVAIGTNPAVTRR